jgi:centrosomal CEP192-like protein/HYDIN/CFA65/VesB family protein/Ig-like domain-containing protein
MPLAVSASQSATFQVWFDPTHKGNDSGTLTLQTDAGLSAGPIALAGTATAPPPQISVTPTSLNVGSATAGTTINGTVTISNLGGSNLTVSFISVSAGPFGVSGITTPLTIAPGTAAPMNVSYSPTIAGTATGSVTITSNDLQNPTSIVSLSGTATTGAVPPSVTTQPGSQTVTAGQTASFSVVAAGTAPLTYQWQKNGANISGATAANYTTPATTTSDSGSTFSVVVNNAAGTATSTSATLTVNAAPAPAIQLSTTSINFLSVVVGNNMSQALIITNAGTATLTITQLTASGAGFSVSGFSLPLNINAGQRTTINAVFAPLAAGTTSGGISIVSNAPTSPNTVSLIGTGTAATLTVGINPTSLSFGSITTGTSSATKSVTITNTGNSSVTISQITASGAGFLLAGGSTPVTLSPAQSLSLGVQFSPTVSGSVSGTISIVSNATGSPATVPLSGTGVTTVQHSVALSWNASTSTVSGYNVYRSTVSGSSYTKINSSLVAGLAYTDATVLSGTTYYYVTTAVDSSSNESTYSNEASAPIP